MGIDIHGIVQVKNGDKWETTEFNNPWFTNENRNTELFGVLYREGNFVENEDKQFLTDYLNMIGSIEEPQYEDDGITLRWTWDYRTLTLKQLNGMYNEAKKRYDALLNKYPEDTDDWFIDGFKDFIKPMKKYAKQYDIKKKHLRIIYTFDS